MALYRYASWLAGMPNFWSGTQLNRENNVISSDHSRGLPRMRVGSRTLTPSVGQCQFRLTATQYRAFKVWWRDTLRTGVLPFEGTFSIYGRTGTLRMQMISEPRYQNQTGGEWTINFEIWAWVVPGLSESEVIDGSIDLATLEILVQGMNDILDSYYDLENQYGDTN